MLSPKLQEQIQRGSMDYPLDYYYVDHRHPRYCMPAHWHHECELIHVLSGAFTLKMDTEPMQLNEGDVAFVAPGRLHSGVPADCVYECVVFDMRLLLNSNDQCKRILWGVLHRSVSIHPTFPRGNAITESAVIPLFNALRANTAAATLLVIGYLWLFFGTVYESGTFQPLPHGTEGDTKAMTQLKTVFDLIEQDYHTPLTLADLSASVHMSPNYFCRFFRSMTHKTPMLYLNHYRIEAACYAIATTRKSITEIALDTGFSNVNYFIRSFRKCKGITPKKYMQFLARGGEMVAGDQSAAEPMGEISAPA